MSEDLLAVRGLTTHIRTDAGTVRPVEDVSLRIAPGEAVAVVGESGCGKSMTALSILRLMPPGGRIVAGQVLFKGVDLTTLNGPAMRSYRGGIIGMIFQDPMTFLNPLHRVGDQICEAVIIHRDVDRKQAWELTREALHRIRIPSVDEVIHYYPHQLSGGMRQRVLIAIAIACRPQLLIADEPTTALDVTIQAQIMTLLRDLRHELGSALLLITHDLGLVAEHCDRVYVMYAGRIVEEAGIDELFAAPKHPYTQALLRSTLRADRRLDVFHTIRGQPPNLIRPPSGCRFHPRCDQALPRCSVQEPGLQRLSPSRTARCVLYETVEA